MPEQQSEPNDSFIIPIGPQHPALKEFEYFELRVDGEQILDVTVRLGYNHRGIEKAIESRTFVQNLYLVERICGICSHAHTTCYCQAVEELLGVRIPDRARYIRTMNRSIAASVRSIQRALPTSEDSISISSSIALHSQQHETELADKTNATQEAEMDRLFKWPEVDNAQSD